MAKLIYLDQSLYSHLARDNPNFPAKESLAEFFEKLSNLNKSGTLIAPISNIHLEECSLINDEKTRYNIIALMEKHSGGRQFCSAEAIKVFALIQYYQAFLHRSDIPLVLGNLNLLKPFGLENIPIDPNEVARFKARHSKALEIAVSGWRNSSLSFSEYLEQEIQIEREMAIEAMKEYLLAIVSNGQTGGTFRSIIYGSLFEYIVSNSRQSEIQENLISFIRSHYFSEVPFIKIEMKLQSLFRHKIKLREYGKRGQKKFSSLYYDFRHISTFAPYCSAIFVDNEMYDYCSNPLVGLTDEFGTNVFSMNKMNEAIAWLMKQ